MGTRQSLLLVLFLLGSGVCLAWILSNTDREGRGQGTVSTTTDGSAEVSHEEALLAVPGAVEDSVSADEDGRGLVDSRGLAAPEASPPPVTAASGGASSQVTGRVLDPDQGPVSGARVLASDRQGFPLDYISEGELPPFLDVIAATTDAEGRYTLRGLEPGGMRMLVRAPGYAPFSEEDVALPEIDSYALEDVILHPGALLEGRVVDDLGAWVAGAELFRAPQGRGFNVFFFPGLQGRPIAVSGDDGSFRIDELALGAWRLRVETEDHPDRTFEGFAERAGEVTGGLLFELERGDVIAGRVVGIPEDEDGELVVRATPRSEGEFFGMSRGDFRDAGVEADGSFFLKGVRFEGEYDLQVRLVQRSAMRRGGWNAVTRSARLPARAGIRGVEVPYQAEAAVLFQVVDAKTSRPLESFQVLSGMFWKQPLSDEAGRLLEQHPEGFVRVGNLRPEAETAQLQLQIDALGYESFSREDVLVVAGEETDLGLILLRPLPSLRVTVLDARTGAPVAGAQVTVEEERPEQEFGSPQSFRGRMTSRVVMEVDDDDGPRLVGDLGRRGVTDAEGLALLTSLEDKRARIRVSHQDYAPGGVENLYLPAGKAVEQTLDLDRGGRVVVEVVDDVGAPVTGARIEHDAPRAEEVNFAGFFGGRRSEDPVTGADGEVAFEHLEPGIHRFRLERSGSRGGSGGRMFFAGQGGGVSPEEPGWAVAEVAELSDSRVTLVRSTPGSLVGKVTEVGSTLVGASLSLARQEPAGERMGGMGFNPRGGGDVGAQTDSSGRYMIEDVDAGAYVLKVSHPKRRMSVEFDVEIESGEQRFDIDLPLSIIEGRVTDEQGTPLAGVEVSASQATQGEESGRRVMVFASMSGGGGHGGVINMGDDLGSSSRTEDDGSYVLRGVLADVELIVTASGDEVQSAESGRVRVAPDAVLSGVNLVMEAAAVVKVEVFTADGSPAQLVIVRATYLDEVPEGVTSGGADPKFSFLRGGSTTLTGMRPGRWTVGANAVGPGATSVGPDDQELQVEVGPAAVLTFHLP